MSSPLCRNCNDHIIFYQLQRNLYHYVKYLFQQL